MEERFSPQSPFGRSVFWLCLLAYGMHVIEEYDLGWQPWAVQVLGLPMTWGDFFITNGFGVMLMNALGFHILPSLRSGAYSPGLISALLLFLPLGGWCMATAFRHHKDSLKLVMPLSVLLMGFPVVRLKLKPLLGY